MTATTAAPASAPKLTIGSHAPAFELPRDGSGTISLESLRGKKVVLYFYPKDDTPGCTIEAKDFRDHIKEFETANAVVIGVSRDSVKSHDKFKEKFCLPFPLLSDEDCTTCEAYGVWVEKSMYGKKYMGVHRVTFLIDEKGIIQHIWNKVKVDGHVKEVLERVKN